MVDERPHDPSGTHDQSVGIDHLCSWVKGPEPRRIAEGHPVCNPDVGAKGLAEPQLVLAPPHQLAVRMLCLACGVVSSAAIPV
jgi:hypothetical protein